MTLTCAPFNACSNSTDRSSTLSLSVSSVISHPRGEGISNVRYVKVMQECDMHVPAVFNHECALPGLHLVPHAVDPKERCVAPGCARQASPIGAATHPQATTADVLTECKMLPIPSDIPPASAAGGASLCVATLFLAVVVTLRARSDPSIRLHPRSHLAPFCRGRRRPSAPEIGSHSPSAFPPAPLADWMRLDRSRI